MNYWMGVTMLDHLKDNFKRETFSIGHGKKKPLDMMKKGDKIVFYLPKKEVGESTKENKFQKIMGFGEIDGGEPIIENIDGKDMLRKKVKFTDTESSVDIFPLLDKLSFTRGHKQWAFPFLKGYVSITKEDWDLIISNIKKKA